MWDTANEHPFSGSDTVIAEQSVEEQGFATGPERALLSALLFDGIQAYMQYMQAKSSKAKAKYREAYAWMNNNKADYVFSFRSVCEALGINPQYLRMGVVNACTSQTVERKRARRRF